MIFRLSSYFVKAIYAVLSAFFIVALSYILGGYEFLVKGVWGTDLQNALSTAVWVDKYFPNVPFWYPIAGGGVSLTHSYPTFAFYIVAFLRRITDLNLVQSFALVGYASIPIMALGIYTLVSVRFKNQTAALIASIFFLVAPITWTFLTDWGFYAEVVSYMFVPWAILFWDLFFVSYLKDRITLKATIYFLLLAIFFSLTFITHYGSGFGLIGLFIFYVIAYYIREKFKKIIFIKGGDISIFSRCRFGSFMPLYHNSI